MRQGILKRLRVAEEIPENATRGSLRSRDASTAPELRFACSGWLNMTEIAPVYPALQRRLNRQRQRRLEQEIQLRHLFHRLAYRFLSRRLERDDEWQIVLVFAWYLQH